MIDFAWISWSLWVLWSFPKVSELYSLFGWGSRLAWGAHVGVTFGVIGVGGYCEVEFRRAIVEVWVGAGAGDAVVWRSEGGAFAESAAAVFRDFHHVCRVETHVVREVPLSFFDGFGYGFGLVSLTAICGPYIILINRSLWFQTKGDLHLPLAWDCHPKHITILLLIRLHNFFLLLNNPVMALADVWPDMLVMTRMGKRVFLQICVFIYAKVRIIEFER